MNKFFASLAVALAIGGLTCAGCARGPQAATEEDALQGIDDIDAFEAESETDDDEGGGAMPDAGGEDAGTSAEP